MVLVVAVTSSTVVVQRYLQVLLYFERFIHCLLALAEALRGGSCH